jgi:hypothetical protein
VSFGGLETAFVRSRRGFLSLETEGRRTDYDKVGGGVEPAETTITGGLAYHFGDQGPVEDGSAAAAPPVVRHPIKKHGGYNLGI